MTGSELFIKALDICGLRQGEFDLPTDTNDLQKRALSLINIILAENSILDSKIRKTEHKVIGISSLEDNIDCSQIVAEAVLPYGLAKLLMLGDDDNLAESFGKIYEAGKKNALTFGKAKAGSILEVYE